MNNFITKARFVTLGLAIAFLPFSILFCHLGLVLCTTLCLFEGSFAQRARMIINNPLMWVLPVFFLLYLVSVVYSENTHVAWMNIEKKGAFFLAPLIIGSATPFTKEELKKLTWVFVGACLAGTVVCLFNVLFIPKTGGWNLGPIESYLQFHSDTSTLWAYFSYIHLSSGIGMHPTYLSLYLLICVLVIFRTVDNKWLSAALIAYLVVFIVFLSSRIVVLATVFILIAAVFERRALIGMIAILFLMIIFINPVALYRNAQEYTASNFSLPPPAISDNPITIRMSLLWLSAKAMKTTNPLIGTGAGDVDDTILLLADKYNTHNILNTYDPHNQFIHTYVAIGAIGLVALAAVFITPLLMLFRMREFWACAGVLAFVAVCLTESALERQKGIVLFSLFVALTGNSTQRLKYA